VLEGRQRESSSGEGKVRRDGGGASFGSRHSGVGAERGGVGGVAESCGGESGPGVVGAAAYDGAVAVSVRTLGYGAL
jgi:hypothetical protein